MELLAVRPEEDITLGEILITDSNWRSEATPDGLFFEDVESLGATITQQLLSEERDWGFDYEEFNQLPQTRQQYGFRMWATHFIESMDIGPDEGSSTANRLLSMGINPDAFFSELLPKSVWDDSNGKGGDLPGDTNVTEFIEAQQERPESQFVLPMERSKNRNHLLNGTQ